MLDSEQRHRYLDIAMIAAHRASAFVRAQWDEGFAIEAKADDSLVTVIDRGCETIIHEVFERHVPEAAFLGEEQGTRGDAGDGEQLWWFVDPIDGTTNLSRRLPWVAISIALMAGGKPQVAVVCNPILEHTFTAVRGEGARLNGHPIHVSACANVEGAMLGTGFAVGQDNPSRIENMAIFQQVMRRCYALRRMGAAALDLASVAAGWLDGFWEPGLHPWDSAAGWLLVEEAGGRVTTFDGASYDPFVPEVVATNGHFHAALTTLVCDARNAHRAELA